MTVVTNDGFAAVASRIGGADAVATLTWIGIGIGGGAEAVGDTQLTTEQTTGGTARAQDGSPSRQTTTQVDDTARSVITFNITATFAITEAGLFDVAGPPVTGILVVRDNFAAVNVISGDTLIVTIDIQVT